MQNKFSALCLSATALLSGIVLSSVVFRHYVIFILLVAAAAGGLIIFFDKKYSAGAVLIFFVFVLIGAWLNKAPSPDLPEYLLNKPVIVRFVVLNEGYYSGFRYRYKVRATDLKLYGGAVNISRKMSAVSKIPLNFGSIYSAAAEFKTIRGRNKLFVYNINSQKKQKTALFALRRKISASIHSAFGPIARPFFLATLLGERQMLSWDIQNSFKKSGLIHLLAISGLHVGLLFLFVRIMLFWLIPFSRLLRDVLSLIVILLYIAAIGAPPSAARAGLMLAVFVVTFYIDRRYNPLNSLALAFVLLVAAAPHLLSLPGFQLSFAATLSIVLFYEMVVKYVRIKVLALTISAQILVLPLAVYYFHYVPILFWIANAVLVPYFGLVLGIGFFTVILNFAGIHLAALRYLSELLVKLLYSATFFVSSLKYATIHILDMPISILIIIYVVAIGILIFKNKEMKIILYFAAAATLLLIILNPFEQGIKMYLLNGQSPLLCFKLQHRMFVINAGFSTKIDRNVRIINAYFKKSEVVTNNVNLASALNAVGKGRKRVFYIKIGNSYTQKRFIFKRNEASVYLKIEGVRFLFLKSIQQLAIQQDADIIIIGSNARRVSIDKYLKNLNPHAALVLFDSQNIEQRSSNGNIIDLAGSSAIIRVLGKNFSIKRRALWLSL